ncbi:MAG TPA: hypothetical protein PKG95_07725 [Anaerolineaceae bacterium]|nr:hypothetical protein [Anaerolineaceae bacterium]
MKQVRFSLRTILIAVALLCLVPGITVLAQEIISSAEPGYVAPAVTVPEQIIGDDPDEDGYTGPITVADPNADIPPSGEGVEVDLKQFLPEGEPQPDEDAYYDQIGVNAEINAGWSHFYYMNVAGSTLRQRASGNNWFASGSGGCVYANDTYNIFNLDAQFPEGARIDYLRIFYYDTSDSNSIAWLTTYDGAGGYSDRTNVYSANNLGYGTTLSDYLGETVINYNNPYLLNWRPMVADNTMQLCGLRVAYRLPIP